MMRQQNLDNDPDQAHLINRIEFENAITIYNDNDSVDKKFMKN